MDEIRYLLSDADRRLKTFLANIAKNKKHIDADTYIRMQTLAQQYRSELSSTTNAREYLRTHLGLIGALITSTDWQSPSFAHAFTSQAGRETGKIYATINDYKRDQHWDAFYFEQAFLKQNIDALIKFPVHVYATSSGMSAFTTILMFLHGEKKMKGKILCGSSIYFQNKWLLLQSFSDQLVFVDESKSNTIIEAIKTHDPSVIFLDSLTNAPDIIAPDLSAIIKILRATKKETFLIIDNTGLSIQFQPIPLLLGRRTNLRLIMFESLNKYHQFGMDRVNAGIIIAHGKGTDTLFDYRVHSGTIISDLAAATLPTPNRKLLTQRLQKHNVNAAFLAGAVSQWIKQNPGQAFEGISYPGIGPYFTLKFKKQYSTISHFKRFVKNSLLVAKRLGVDLTSGTSFGLDKTRIYLTAVRSKPNAPFVRVAAGIEDPHPLGDVFIQTLKQF